MNVVCILGGGRGVDACALAYVEAQCRGSYYLTVDVGNPHTRGLCCICTHPCTWSEPQVYATAAAALDAFAAKLAGGEGYLLGSSPSTIGELRKERHSPPPDRFWRGPFLRPCRVVVRTSPFSTPRRASALCSPHPCRCSAVRLPHLPSLRPRGAPPASPPLPWAAGAGGVHGPRGRGAGGAGGAPAPVGPWGSRTLVERMVLGGVHFQVGCLQWLQGAWCLFVAGSQRDGAGWGPLKRWQNGLRSADGTPLGGAPWCGADRGKAHW